MLTCTNDRCNSTINRRRLPLAGNTPFPKSNLANLASLDVAHLRASGFPDVVGKPTEVCKLCRVVIKIQRLVEVFLPAFIGLHCFCLILRETDILIETSLSFVLVVTCSGLACKQLISKTSTECCVAQKIRLKSALEPGERDQF